MKITKDAAMYKEYLPWEKMFIIMPFVHAEDREVTGRSVTLAQEVDDDLKSHPKYDEGLNFIKMTKFMVDHNTTVQTYGRYPHRNECLGR